MKTTNNMLKTKNTLDIMNQFPCKFNGMTM